VFWLAVQASGQLWARSGQGRDGVGRVEVHGRCAELSGFYLVGSGKRV
jgi:hypothetical protein